MTNKHISAPAFIETNNGFIPVQEVTGGELAAAVHYAEKPDNYAPSYLSRLRRLHRQFRRAGGQPGQRVFAVLGVAS
jgi:hypothetical protein